MAELDQAELLVVGELLGCTKSSIAEMLPQCAIPKTEKADSERARWRAADELPEVKKSSTNEEAPERAIPKIDEELAKRA